jgi:FkbM family methyltransferase
MGRRVFIGTPCYSGKTTMNYTVSLLNTFRMAPAHGVDLELVYTRGDALVQKSRNYCVAYALQNGADDLIFIDDDLLWRPEWVFELLRFPVDVVSGIYPKRTDEEAYPFIPMENEFGEWFPPAVDVRTGLLQVKGVPTGFLRLSRKAMQVLWNASQPYKNGVLPEERAIFDISIIGDTMYSEDYTMCHKLFNAKIPVWLDPRKCCGHEGMKLFDTRMAEWLMNTALKDNFWPRLWMELMHTGIHQCMTYKEWREGWKPTWDFLQESKQKGFSPRVIYDIGACYGEWGAIAKETWPEARVIMFEANPECQPFLQTRGEHYIQLLSNEDDRTVKYYTSNTITKYGNSYYRELTNFYSPDKFVEMKTRTLDSVVREYDLPLPDFIKIDVQGAEIDVLRGAREALKTAKALFVELQHKQYNEGAMLVNESLPLIESMGFKNIAKIKITEVDADYAFIPTESLDDIFFNKLWEKLSALERVRRQNYKIWRNFEYSAYLKYILQCKEFIDPPRVIFDIGAGLGVWSEMFRFAWPEARVISIEANPECKPFLTEGYTEVLGDMHGRVVDFYTSNTWPERNSYYKQNNEFTTTHVESRQMTTLDHFIETNNLPYPDFVKIDVCGAEYDVITGASKTLSSAKYIFVKLGNSLMNIGSKNSDKILKICGDMGFKIVNVANDDCLLVREKTA